MLRPITFGSPPSRLRQKFFVIKRYIGTFFFLRQKISAEDRTHAQEHRSNSRSSAAEDLDRIAQPGQSKGSEIFGGETVENFLAVAIMLIARRRQREIHQIARLVAAEEVNNTRRFLEGQTAQKKIVDQTEDRGVQPDPERERDDRDEVKPGDLRS